VKIRSDLPIILCTGYSEAISVDQSQKDWNPGADDETVRIREIARTMRKVLDGKT